MIMKSIRITEFNKNNVNKMPVIVYHVMLIIRHKGVLLTNICHSYVEEAMWNEKANQVENPNSDAAGIHRKYFHHPYDCTDHRIERLNFSFGKLPFGAKPTPR